MTNSDGTLDDRLYTTMDYFNGTTILDISGAVLERFAYAAEPHPIPRSGRAHVVTPFSLDKASSFQFSLDKASSFQSSRWRAGHVILQPSGPQARRVEHLRLSRTWQDAVAGWVDQMTNEK